VIAMVDVVPPEKRSAMMSGIRGSNTTPEVVVRKALFAAGYRYRLQRRDLPGRPDVVMPGRKVAIFVHGCFWHHHQDCRFAKVPATRPEFWEEKLKTNKARDARCVSELQAMGWRVLVVWECFLRTTKSALDVQSALTDWIESDKQAGELREQLAQPAESKKKSD
jgi:DNA mismatch endonuclease (patch repair protein)